MFSIMQVLSKSIATNKGRYVSRNIQLVFTSGIPAFGSVSQNAPSLRLNSKSPQTNQLTRPSRSPPLKKILTHAISPTCIHPRLPSRSPPSETCVQSMADDPSNNALKHGCTSKKRILPGESEEEWKQLEQAWLDEYQPTNDNFLSLVRQAVGAEWNLNRNLRAYHDTLQSIYTRCDSPTEWTEEDHKSIERFTRYKTTAERSFQRARNLVENTRQNRLREAHRREQLELAWTKERRLSETRASKKTREPKQAPEPQAKIVLGTSPVIPAISQYIDVQTKDEKTVSAIDPSNEEILQQSATMDPPPQLIYRNLCFHHGIPPEYEWVDDEIERHSNCCTQELPFDVWLALIEHETGEHIGPRNPITGTEPRA
jgi:hypothetical protein